MRCVLVCVLWAGHALAQVDASPVALEPYLLAQYINSHARVDLGPLRATLRIEDPAILTEPCENHDCRAEVIEVPGANPTQVILWNSYKQSRSAFWLRYQREPGAPWQFISGRRVLGKTLEPERRVTTAFGKPFLIVTGLGAGGAAAASTLEIWFDLSALNAQPVLSFTRAGSQSRGCGYCFVKRVKATATAVPDGGMEQVRVERTVTFQVQGNDAAQKPLDLGSRTATAVYARQGSGPFKLSPALSSEPKAALSSDFDISDGAGMTNEQFLRFDISGLRPIASAHGTPAAEWLASFLKTCKDTPEKAELLRLLQ